MLIVSTFKKLDQILTIRRSVFFIVYYSFMQHILTIIRGDYIISAINNKKMSNISQNNVIVINK